MNPRVRLLLAVPLVLACRAARPPVSAEPAALHDLIDDEWVQRLEDDPLLATSVGVRIGEGALPNVTPRAQKRRAARAEKYLRRLEAIDASALHGADFVNYAVLRAQLEDRITEFSFGAYQIPINADSGFHTAFARLPSELPFEEKRDYVAYISRLNAFPGWVDQHIANMRAGLARGMCLPRVVLAGYGLTASSHITEDPETSVFFEPLRSFPAAISAVDRERLTQRARSAIRDSVVPGYRNFLRFLEDEYVPSTRTTIGCSELPEGRAYYDYLVRHFTTLEVTPEEVHRIGLEEVERIRDEMQSLIEGTGFEGNFAAFLDFLRTDDRFYAQSPEELLERATSIAQAMEARLPKLFGELPSTPYAVAPVPAHLAPKYTSGRYVPSPEGSGAPGYYWVNTYALNSRPLYALPALTLHEAIPGHHLQISLSSEAAELPPFRRYSYLSAFGEGWGLYSEWLGVEAGMYSDPYDDFGRLTYEMWRACRLVVDTGIHALGWTREQAQEYMASRTALSLHEVTTEIDRYISWPGQALAYKMGELTIKRLRREAEETLGDRFDVRAFHDVVLRNGSVPLGVLTDEVRRWIAGP